MSARQQVINELKAFLEQISPETRDKLRSALEQDIDLGDDSSHSQIILDILDALTPVDADSKVVKERFFQAVYPFTTPHTSDKKQKWLIPESALDDIWAWMFRDCISVELLNHLKSTAESIKSGSEQSAQESVDAAREEAALEFAKLVNKARQDADTFRRLTNHISSGPIIDHISEIATIFQHVAEIEASRKQFPMPSDPISDEFAEEFERTCDEFQFENSAPLELALAAYSARFEKRTDVLIPLVKVMGTDDANDLHHSRYQILVDLALAELNFIKETIVDCPRSDFFTDDVQSRIALLASGMRKFTAALDLSGKSVWARQLADIRSTMSDKLAPQLASPLKEVKSILSAVSNPVLENGPDPMLVENALAMLDMQNTLIRHAGDLAVRDRATQAHTRLVSYLEAANTAVTNAIRMSSELTLPYALEYLDFAVSVNERVHNAEFAATLRRLGLAARPRRAG